MTAETPPAPAAQFIQLLSINHRTDCALNLLSESHCTFYRTPDSTLPSNRCPTYNLLYFYQTWRCHDPGNSSFHEL